MLGWLAHHVASRTIAIRQLHVHLRYLRQVTLGQHLENNFRTCCATLVACDWQILVLVQHQRPVALDLRLIFSRSLSSKDDRKSLKTIAMVVVIGPDFVEIPKDNEIALLP